MTKTNELEWKPSACMLCSIGCGIEAQVTGGQIKKVRGDKSNAVSEGYICQKAAKLNHYQNHAMRLQGPLRKNAKGEFEAIDWDTAIREIADKFIDIKSKHGGKAFAFYGGGGQGNHLGGSYSGALRAALDTPYLYSALAQEKTGDFWVNGRLFGKQSCYVTENMAHADYSIVLGANPWSAHGVQKTRDVLKAIKKDPSRTLVVIDPRVTETAKMADIHLQVKPGKDAWLLAAMIAEIFHAKLEDTAFLKTFTTGISQLRQHFLSISVEEYACVAGVDAELVRKVAHGFAKARTGSVRADLGIQQSHNSTLNSYFEKLLFLVTGKFNREGCNHLVSQFAPLLGHSKSAQEGGVTTSVTGMEGISKLFPPNILPHEILSESESRVRALIVDSANPALSAADTQAYEAAFEALELLVVIDVAMTETAARADYVLPAQTQFEKAECTFFTFGFPEMWFHLREPIMAPAGDTLPEPEIYRRLLVAMSEIPERFFVLEKAFLADQLTGLNRVFPLALQATFKISPHWQKYSPIVLYAAMKSTLPEDKASAAALWGVSQLFCRRHGKAVRRAGIKEKGLKQGQALFKRILESNRPVMLAKFSYDETWDMLKTDDGKVHLAIPELLVQVDALSRAEDQQDKDYPFTLMAGERRAYNANQIFRTPDWRKTDKEGGLRIHPDDMATLGVDAHDKMKVISRRGVLVVGLLPDDGMPLGVVSLPHGYGMKYRDNKGEKVNGPIINLLTDANDCDPIAKTPYHKQVAVRLEKESS